MMSRLTLIICAAILVFQIGGCAGQPQLAQTSLCHGAACNADPYIIGPGDVLHIAVWKNTNLDRVVTVRPDGDISFPLLNDIHVVGMTPDKLRISIKSKLAKFMVVPEVSVVVQEVHSFVVSVLGEVKKPGRYEFQSDVTVLDVLAKAGGLTDFAKESSIVILRENGGTRERLPFDYDTATAAKGRDSLLQVRPGDIVVVP